MARKEKELNAVEKWRRKEKRKLKDARRRDNQEKLNEIPVYQRDPSQLVSEIYRLDVLEYEGKLNSDMKSHKKRLIDRYMSIKKARTAANLETIELIEFDPELHEEKGNKQGKKSKIVDGLKSKVHTKEGGTIDDPFDERGFPRLPSEDEPGKEGIPGLPNYLNTELLFEDRSEDKIFDLSKQTNIDQDEYKAFVHHINSLSHF